MRKIYATNCELIELSINVHFWFKKIEQLFLPKAVFKYANVLKVINIYIFNKTQIALNIAGSIRIITKQIRYICIYVLLNYIYIFISFLK